MFDSFLMVQRMSACSPTGHSPKSNFAEGEMLSRTGRAVPVNATSAYAPGRS